MSWVHLITLDNYNILVTTKKIYNNYMIGWCRLIRPCSEHKKNTQKFNITSIRRKKTQLDLCRLDNT